jgi:hypothetical protein
MRLTTAFIAFFLVWVGPTHATPRQMSRVTITAAGSVMPAARTGRLFLMISHRAEGEPRLLAPATFAYYFNDPSVPYAALFAQDVNEWGAGRPVVMDGHAVGYPYRTMQELPDGEYSVQVIFNVYTKFARSDGHSIYGHADHGEGQQFQISPGNLISEPQIVRVARSHNLHLHLTLSRVIPPIAVPADTKFVKRFSFRSELVSRFWGADMEFGAIVVLPKGYDEHPDAHYPVVFHMGHF